MNNDYEINQKSLAEFFSCGYVLQDRTLADNIYSLGPAEIMYGNKENSKLLRYKYFEYHKSLKKKIFPRKNLFIILMKFLIIFLMI